MGTEHDKDLEEPRTAGWSADKGPADPQQGDEGFETGYDQRRDTPEEELPPNFARGISEEPPEGERHGRFSTGHEDAPDSPEKDVERRFSEGIEQSPTSR